MDVKCLVTAMLLVLGSCSNDYESLYLLEITFPPSPGRMEYSEIMELHNTITNMDGIKVIFFVMQVGNSRLQAVLDIEDVCTWTTLTDALSQAGVEVKTEPVVSCDHFAQELKADVKEYRLPFKNPVKHVVESVYLDKGMSEEEYNNLLRTEVEQVQKIYDEHDWDQYCFRTAVDMPARVITFTNEPLREDFDVTSNLHSVEWTIRRLHSVLDLQSIPCCQH